MAGNVGADENGVVLADQFLRQFVVVEPTFECAVGEDQMGFRIVIGTISHGWLNEKERERRKKKLQMESLSGTSQRPSSFVLFVSGSELKLGLIKFHAMAQQKRVKLGQGQTSAIRCRFNSLPCVAVDQHLPLQPGEAHRVSEVP